MSQSVWEAITKSQRLGSLNNENLFLRILKAGKPQTDSVSGVDSLPCYIFTCQEERKEPLLPLMKGLISFNIPPLSRPNYLSNVPPSTAIVFGVKISIDAF